MSIPNGSGEISFELPLSSAVARRTFPQALANLYDSFRLGADVGGYCGRILAILFLKVIEDLGISTDQSADEAVVNIGGVFFQVPDEVSFKSLWGERRKLGNGSRLDRALRTLEDANPSLLMPRGTRLSDAIPFNADELGDAHQRNVRLAALLEGINELDLALGTFANPVDELRPLISQLLDHVALANKGSAGEIHVPDEVAALIFRLMAPKSGEAICDPICGSGALLRQFGIRTPDGDSSEGWSIFGQEAHLALWATAELSILLSGVRNHLIRLGDPIRSPMMLESEDVIQKYDVVVGNLLQPIDQWSVDAAEGDPFGRFWRGLPPKGKGEYAYISHMIETLDPKSGRMAVVASSGALFRGASEARIRKQLVEENLLSAVVGLPEKLFYTSSAPAVLLIFDKAKTDKKILLIDAGREYTPGKSQNSIPEEAVSRLVAVVQGRQEIEGYSRLVDVDEIRAADFNLNISRYLSSNEMTPKVDRDSLVERRYDLMRELQIVHEKINNRLKAFR